MIDEFWYGKRVLVTGHTGFKGSWMTLMLNALGAKVIGFSDEYETTPSMFKNLSIAEFCINSEIGDIRNLESIKRVLQIHEPEIIIHMAAQSIVSIGYKDPVKTFSTNIIGTTNLLEAVRTNDTSVGSIICVTSDKSYENLEIGRSILPFPQTLK